MIPNDSSVNNRLGLYFVIYNVGPFLIKVGKRLVTNYGEGGATKREGGQVKCYPYEKGDGKSFSHAEGGGGDKTFWGSLYAEA